MPTFYAVIHDARLPRNVREHAAKGTLFTGQRLNVSGSITLSAPRYNDIEIPAELVSTVETYHSRGTDLQELRRLFNVTRNDGRTSFGNGAYISSNRQLPVQIAVCVNGGYHFKATGFTIDSDDTVRGHYNEGSTTAWINNQELRNENHIQILELVSTNITANGVTHMPDLNSPNKDKSYRNLKIVNISDAELINQIVQLSNYKAVVETGVLTEDQVIRFGGITAKDYAGGLDLLKSELTFRENREALAELARLEAELESLKTREQKQKDAEAKKAELLAKIPQNLRPE